ncbi:hypothetical protein CVT26_012232 [Gymnopilus dilepis]|uniref:Uncharacterized protein n=1 Tax=Gymnopilus dilepis TaxID=231916 RepID=A0A409YQ74_9AGAR|nr:hypothetical protein CVT26_012232 [Gymnopilus dilepis]
MRLSSAFVFLGLVTASVLAYPLYADPSSLDIRSPDDDLALRELYDSGYIDELVTRDFNDEPVSLEARYSIPMTAGEKRRRLRRRLRGRAFNDLDDLNTREFGEVDGLNARDREFDEVDNFNARDYDDFEELEARNSRPKSPPRVRWDAREYKMEDMDVREDYEEGRPKSPPRVRWDAREYKMEDMDVREDYEEWDSWHCDRGGGRTGGVSVEINAPRIESTKLQEMDYAGILVYLRSLSKAFLASRARSRLRLNVQRPLGLSSTSDTRLGSLSLPILGAVILGLVDRFSAAVREEVEDVLGTNFRAFIAVGMIGGCAWLIVLYYITFIKPNFADNDPVFGSCLFVSVICWIISASSSSLWHAESNLSTEALSMITVRKWCKLLLAFQCLVVSNIAILAMMAIVGNIIQSSSSKNTVPTRLTASDNVQSNRNALIEDGAAEDTTNLRPTRKNTDIEALPAYSAQQVPEIDSDKNMRLSSAFVFLGLVAASALAYPLYEESSSLDARSADEDLALRDLEYLEARFHNPHHMEPVPRVVRREFEDGGVYLRGFDDLDEVDAREYDDLDDLYAREYDELDDLYAREYFDELNDLDAREYDDLEELEARHEGHHGGPSITIHLRDDEMEEFDELFARFGYEDEMEDMEARELEDFEEGIFLI